MTAFDHVPWSDVERQASAAPASLLTYPPGGTPARDDAPAAAAPAPSRFVKFGDAMICTVCQLDARYCRGHAPADPPAPDGTESGLAKRIREARAQAGGR